MKRFLAVLLAVCLLCGCQKIVGRRGEKPAVPTAFESKVTVTQYKKTYEALVKYIRGKNAELLHTAPKQTAGLRVSLTPFGVRCDFLGVTYQNHENVLPPGHFLSLLDGVMTVLESPDCFTVREFGEKLVYDGQAGGVPFTLEQNLADRALTRLSVGAYDCEAVFSDFVPEAVSASGTMNN